MQYPKNTLPSGTSMPCIVHIREYPTPPLRSWGRTLRKFGKRFAAKALKSVSPSQLLGLESRNAPCAVQMHS